MAEENVTISSSAPQSLGQAVLVRWKELDEIWDKYKDLWEDITDLVNPRRYDLEDNVERGKKRGVEIYDGTAPGALSVWADGIQGFMVSQSMRWFRSVMSKPDMNKIDEVRVWLQQYDEAMYAAFNRGNFYSVLGEWIRDAGSVGTATLYTEEDMGNKSAVHVPMHPREIRIAEDRYGNVDTVYRNFTMTARQAYQKFQRDKHPANLGLPPNIVRMAETNPEHTVKIVHAVQPNKERMFGKWDFTNKPYSSIYVERESQKVIRQSGYDVMPYVVWRFRKNSDEVYGYSPAADAIIEIFGLNQIGKTMITAAHLSVEPPMNVPAEMRGEVRLIPKGRNYYESEQRIITPVQTGINFPIGIDREERLQKSIEDKFGVDFFLTLTRARLQNRELTATEVIELQSEKAQLMGAQVDRLINEGLAKIFDIVSEIEDRGGRLPPPPDIVLEAGGRINIDFIGPLVQAQKRLFLTQPIMKAVQDLAPLAQLWPSVLDWFDEDQAAELILEGHNVPQRVVRNEQEVLSIRQAKAEAAQQQQMQMAAAGAAEAVPKLSKGPEPGSPMEKIMDMAGP
jgi:hypothetical protein